MENIDKDFVKHTNIYNGKVAYIRFKRNDEKFPRKVTLKLQKPNDVECYYVRPDRTFNGTVDVICHILDNLETDGIKIEVL